MSITVGRRCQAARRVALLAAAILPICAAASSAQALDSGVTSNSGELRVNVGPGATSFEYQLRYDVEGTVMYAHLQLGDPGTRGFAVWLCGTPSNPGPAGTPTCPGSRSGAVTGTVSAANVVGPAGPGVAPAEFGLLLQAMREGMTTARVATTKHRKGEIKGQLK